MHYILVQLERVFSVAEYLFRVLFNDAVSNEAIKRRRAGWHDEGRVGKISKAAVVDVLFLNFLGDTEENHQSV